MIITKRQMTPGQQNDLAVSRLLILMYLKKVWLSKARGADETELQSIPARYGAGSGKERTDTLLSPLTGIVLL